VKNVLVELRGFMEDEAEVLPDIEKEAKSAKIIAGVCYVKAKKKYDVSTTSGGSVELNALRCEKIRINQSLRDRNIQLTVENHYLLNDRKMMQLNPL
jgi:hypothetical protein